MEVKIVLFNQAQVTSLVMIFTVCYNMVYVPFYSEKKKKKRPREKLTELRIQFSDTKFSLRVFRERTKSW